MKKYYLILLLFCSNTIADPFFGEENQIQTENQTYDNSTSLSDCKPSENHFSLNLPIEFEKLKLVGLIEIDKNITALFIDENNQLFDFKENDLINNKTIEIKNINLKSVTYVNWKLTQNCDSLYEITLKL